MGGLRHENKYFISQAAYYMLRSRLNCSSRVDFYAKADGQYKIRSLYFDDIFQSAYYDKIDGVENREKFRIRYYNDDDSFIRLESKQKLGKMTKKLSSRLTRPEVERIISGDTWFLFDKDDELLRRFYLQSRLHALKPTVIVDYIREAYIFEDVRITFDMSLHTGNFNCNLFDPDLPTLPVLPADRVIVEVKYDEKLPDKFSSLIEPAHPMVSAVSKYTLCRSYF
ncbi:MAG: polyphosphate polymerase domain-containing protein [Clostridiales bacterium]|nr:polyphosphate polymerase domain-containing protein [Clostridiales bacterium]